MSWPKAATSTTANPFNGRAGFFDVPAGTYDLHLSQAPDGVDPIDDIDDVEVEPGVEGSGTWSPL